MMKKTCLLTCLLSIIDEVLKFVERSYFMQTIPVIEASKEKKQA